MTLIQMLYLATGGIFAAAFVPQIISLLKDKTGAASMSLSTWGTFSLCSIIALIYSSQVNQDINFVISSALGAVGNLTVFGLALWRRLGKNTLEDSVHVLGVVRKVE